MKSSFYDLLLVSPDADTLTLRRAWQESLANLVRRTRVARDQGQDSSRLEEERSLLEEAWDVLSEPGRRARYDRYLALTAIPDRPLPDDAEDLWTLVSGSMLDPSARATMELLGTLTGLGAEREPVFDTSIRVRTPAPMEPPPRPAQPPPPLAQTPQPPLQVLRLIEPEPDSEPDLSDSLVPIPTLADKKVPPWRVGGAQPPGASTVSPPSDLQSLVSRLGYSGQFLKKVRENKGITLEQVAAQSRISLRYLEAIENDDHARLPATTFVRGYLREVARILGLDPETISNGYLAGMNRDQG